jgi:NADPH:quinone reductase-like Zn-dependent oxidoreductase
MFALLICIAAGIKPIITSSSDLKLESIKKLGPDVYGINYKTTEGQGPEVLRATDGKGVDVVINTTGVASLLDDLQLLRARGGTISLVGFLDGFKADWNPNALMAIMGKAAKVKLVPFHLPSLYY